jgi:hypothetical protein
MFKCSQCLRVFPTRERLKRHVEMIHGDLPDEVARPPAVTLRVEDTNGFGTSFVLPDAGTANPPPEPPPEGGGGEGGGGGATGGWDGPAEAAEAAEGNTDSAGGQE